VGILVDLIYLRMLTTCSVLLKILVIFAELII
jgi:hypothetical protein